MKHSEPFTHITAKNVFTSEFYSSLTDVFVNYLVEQINILKIQNKGNRMAGDYKTMIFNLDKNSPALLNVFLSDEWHSLLSSYCDIKCTKDISVAIHYHRKGSMSGSVHNDLNPGWFIESPDNEINIASGKRCNYKFGSTSPPGQKVKQTVRSLVMIYYLNNPPIEMIGGGGSGLYKNFNQKIDEPSVIIPPENNSLLIFACTPFSYHSFISNKNDQRCSIILWLHTPIDVAIQKWGAENIVYW